MTEHKLKTLPEYFQAVKRGEKRAELRRNDRGFAVGDTLLLEEWDDVTEAYTGRWFRVRVTHVLADGPWLTPGYAMLSIEPCEDQSDRGISNANYLINRDWEYRGSYWDLPWQQVYCCTTAEAIKIQRQLERES